MSSKGDRRDSADDGDPALRRPPSTVSLLGQRPEPGEAPPPGGRDRAGDRDQQTGESPGRESPGHDRPSRDRASGADPLRSAHSTFRDLEPPRDDFDAEKARAVTAQIARDALRDFAPALVLLPAAVRPRVQAFIAYARTLLDFARDRSLEGERLAQINRCEFTLEAALGGEPPGQPVFVQLAALERAAPWPRQAFDEVASIARSRISVGLPTNARAAEAQRRRLARAAMRALLGDAVPVELEPLGAAILRAASLLAWREALWFVRPDLGLGAEDGAARFRDVVAGEARDLLVDLEHAHGGVRAVPDRFGPAARYAALAAVAIARQVAARPERASPPRLSAATRFRLLLQARLGG